MTCSDSDEQDRLYFYKLGRFNDIVYRILFANSSNVFDILFEILQIESLYLHILIFRCTWSLFT